MPYKIVKVHLNEQDFRANMPEEVYNQVRYLNNCVLEVLSERVEALMKLGYKCQGGITVVHHEGGIVQACQAMAY